MLTLPAGFAKLILPFACLFSKRVFQSAQVLLAGASLAPGKRTVTSVLRIMGLSQERHFQTYRRVLNRAAWSSLAASRILLHLLVRAFAPGGPLVFGLDDTIERRWGMRIAVRGIYRDPVRSSRSHFVKVSGLRWLCMMLRVAIPWAARVWALPFLSMLCPSQRYHDSLDRRHKKLTDWARQMVKQVRRWLPGRPIVIVADRAFAALDFLGAARRHATVITRLRLDAALYAPAPERSAGQRGRTRLKGERLPVLSQVLANPATAWTALTIPFWYGEHDRAVEVASGTAVWYHPGMVPIALRWVLIRDPLKQFETQALLSTDSQARPAFILDCFVQRWQVEVTFEEARAHLGVETQRQWSSKAIARTTPCLLGLYSLVALAAQDLFSTGQLSRRCVAWYPKPQATFSDTIACVRRDLWSHGYFSCFAQRSRHHKNPAPLGQSFYRLALLCGLNGQSPAEASRSVRESL
jgi:hypothetical protein